VGKWKPSRWYRVIDFEGVLWMETSDREEAIEEAKVKGFTVYRMWVREQIEWREEDK
jgi:hypothetical protein